jgi:HK97 gp10 family phage protein
MAGVFFDVSGFDVLMTKMNKMSNDIQENVLYEVNASALNVQSNAKKYVPVNLGQLRNSIQLKESLSSGKLVFTIGSKLSYAPYIEFGTGGKVSIPNGYSEFANQFRGKTGGTFAQLLKALIEWVKRKGIVGTYSVKTGRRTGGKAIQQKQNESAAYAIAISILRKGLRPQPFLIPAYEQEIPKLKDNLKRILNAKS